jgi:hypothetical protein
MAIVKEGWQIQVIDESVFFPRESIPLTERELFVDVPRLTMDIQDVDERERLIREHFPQLADEHVDRLKRLYRPKQD